MDLRRLAHLVTLADERHFARAAERVHLSQPAFSRSIQTIEAELGVRLFDRQVGDVRPTPSGDFVVERARRLLFDARCLQRDVDLYRNSQLGDTAFGAGPFPTATLMPQVLTELRREHPNVALRVEVGNWAQLLDRLRTEDVEFFVSEGRDLPHDPALELRALGRQRGRFYARAGHPLARRRSCTLSEAWAHGVASTRLPDVVVAALAALLGLAAGEVPRLALQCDDVAVLRAIALATDTVLAVTDASVRADLKSGALKALRVAELPETYSDMRIVSLRNRTPSPMAQRAIACIERVAAAVGG